MAESHAAGAAEHLTDEDLLERFTSRREEAAFAVLVRRHGRLVLAVCRRVLQHEQDAEDAVQAVFCVLARRAGSIRKRGSVAAWLHAVAYRIARKAQAGRRRRPVPTTDLADIPAAEGSPEWVWRELRPILDEEVNQLPEKYRQAFVLCYLEGRTNEQAATQIGCPLGTVLSRLARARERLRGRLTRRGLVLSAGALAVALATEAVGADVPPRLTEAAFRAATAFTAGRGAAGALSPSVSALTTGYLQSRFRTRAIRVAVGLLAGILVGILLLLLRRPLTAVLRDRAPAPPPQADQQLLQGTWVANRVEGGGMIVPGGGIRMTFAGDQFTLTSNFGWNIAARFRLDAARNPREITLLPEQGGEWPGIYLLEGDSLKLFLNQGGSERPKTFTTEGREGIFLLYVLEREPAAP